MLAILLGAMNQLARYSLAAFLVFPVFAQLPKAAKTEETGGGDVERGKYIVESVAMCGRCHTPGGDGGHPDRFRWLQGAPIRDPEPNWAVQSARIAGTPPGTDQEFIGLMTTG